MGKNLLRLITFSYHERSSNFRINNSDNNDSNENSTCVRRNKKKQENNKKVKFRIV